MNNLQPAREPARLWNKNFVLLWQGQLISQIGQRYFNVGMLFYIKQATESASLMGAMMLFSTLPGVLMGPMGGTFADRFSRKKIIVYSDLIQGILVFSLAALMFFLIWATGLIATDPQGNLAFFSFVYLTPHATVINIIWMFIVATLGAIIFAFFTPAMSAAIPDLVPKEKLNVANSLNQFAIFLAMFLGQGLGGLIFSITGAPLLFLINSATYLYAAGTESFISIPQPPIEPEKKPGEAWKSFIRDTKEGLSYVWNEKGMRILFLAAALLHLAIAPMLLLLPFYVEDYLKQNASWYGYLLAAVGLGSVVGYLIAGSVNVRGKAQSKLIILSLLSASISLGIVGFVTQPFTVLGIVTVIGLTAGIFIVKTTTVIQLAASSEIRGRVFGLLGTLTSGLAPIGMGIAGVIADMANKNIPIIYATCGLMVLAMSIGLAMSKEAREFLALDVTHRAES
jgi:DHA3 family macrolide efflux protein-like MFS transporter